MKITQITSLNWFDGHIQVRFDSNRGTGDILLENWAYVDLVQCSTASEVMALVQPWIDGYDLSAIGNS